MNTMNQYGNNLNAPYGQNGYSPFFIGKQYQQESPSNNLLWVQGIEGAKALMLPPNSKIICLDSEIKDITQYQLNKISTNYDMINIIEQQDKII